MEDHMMRKVLLAVTATAFAAAVFAASAGGADQSKGRAVTIPTPRTTPVSGKQMYASYCAPCHGVNGKGGGPVGAALKTNPTDLTVLSRNNDGKFPAEHVISVLQLGAEIPSHGTSEMPVWGPVLGKMDPTITLGRPLRISNLTNYLKTIQAK
jgi:mono/diheme cytochrome c family protein